MACHIETGKRGQPKRRRIPIGNLSKVRAFAVRTGNRRLTSAAIARAARALSPRLRIAGRNKQGLRKRGIQIVTS
jgi:hypothetical protein